MFQYRQALVRLRAGDSERQIARSGVMGREKLAAFRSLASAQGWLDPQQALPADETLAAALGQARRSRSTVSSAEPWREQITEWVAQDVQGVAIHAALCRLHGYSGSYSSVHRLIRSIKAATPPEATIRLHYAPAEVPVAEHQSASIVGISHAIQVIGARSKP